MRLALGGRLDELLDPARYVGLAAAMVDRIVADVELRFGRSRRRAPLRLFAHRAVSGG